MKVTDIDDTTKYSNFIKEISNEYKKNKPNNKLTNDNYIKRIHDLLEKFIEIGDRYPQTEENKYDIKNGNNIENIDFYGSVYVLYKVLKEYVINKNSFDIYLGKINNNLINVLTEKDINWGSTNTTTYILGNNNTETLFIYISLLLLSSKLSLIN